MKTSFSSYNPETMARAVDPDAAISFKVSIEIAKRLRGMMTDKAERYLEAVIAKKEAVPFTRYTNGLGHKAGAMASGRYPVKAASEFLRLMKLGVANAENKGLGTPLKIIHIAAQKASSPLRYGRHRGLSSKRTGLDLILAETEGSKRKPRKQKAKVKPKPAAAVEQKPAPVKEAPKAEKKVEKESEKKVEKKAEPVKAAPKVEKPVEKAAAKPKEDTHNHEDVN